MTAHRAPAITDGETIVYRGNCLDALRDMPDSSVHAIVTDPPYGLANTSPAQVADTITRWVAGERDYLPSGAGFMGKAWDAFVPPVAVWDECLRVLKPGGHVLAFAGSRTVDLMTLGLRLAGFDIRDSIAWLYGSGFPKSLDVSKAIDKALGHAGVTYGAPVTPAAAAWQGWGTALKPAFEPVVVARKPLGGTVAANVLEHGTGALDINACRIRGERIVTTNGRTNEVYGDLSYTAGEAWESHPSGRWPANVVLDESQAAQLDQQSGESSSRIGKPRGAVAGDGWGMTATGAEYSDSGGASRFFYVAKADSSERPRVNGIAHSTVKPLTLMRWLVRLVTPPGGTVLDPFAGSGTTLEAARLEGFACIGVEREADHLPLIRARIARTSVQVERDVEDLAATPADPHGTAPLF